jgi:hypothetical protein
MSKSTNDAILEAIKNFLDKNENYTKKEFIDIIKVIYDNNTKKTKKNKKDKEEKEKKPLNAYQEFMKEQRPIINARENAKGEGEIKLNTREIMKEIAEKWKLKKEGLLHDANEFLKSDDEEEKPKKKEFLKSDNEEEEKPKNKKILKCDDDIEDEKSKNIEKKSKKKEIVKNDDEEEKPKNIEKKSKKTK